jgi:hypothetical protein
LYHKIYQNGKEKGKREVKNQIQNHGKHMRHALEERFL